ncbi:WD40-repeat-containing domain protein [Amanita rubescens]|nr:WD40-repeat-containing domain protein [Amanita rubescens]
MPPQPSTSNGGPSLPTLLLTNSVMSRLKPAKVFKNSVEPTPPSTPSNFGQRTPNGSRHITGISFDDRGDTLVTAAEDETFRLYNCKTGKTLKTLYSKKYGVDLPRFTHKNTTIVHASTKEDDTIRYHSLHDNKYLQYFRGHKGKVISLEVSPVDDGFMSGSMDKTVRLWDLRSQASNFDKVPFLVITLEDPTLARVSYPPRPIYMTSMSFSSNGKYLLVGCSGDAHYIVDAFEGHLLAKLEGHIGLERRSMSAPPTIEPSRGSSGEEVCWTPDSKFVIGGSLDGKILVWDVQNLPARSGEVDLKIPPAQILPLAGVEGHPGPVEMFAMMCSAGAELAFWLPDPSGDAEEIARDLLKKGSL